MVMPSKRMADACCHCRVCGGETDKGGYGSQHTECWQRDYRRGMDAKLAAAELLDSWDGWVWDSETAQGFYENLGAYRERLECDMEDEESWPERVFVCRERPFPAVRIKDVLDRIREHFEDVVEFEGIDELAEAIRRFNAANEHVVAYVPDYRRAVRVARDGAEPRAKADRPASGGPAS